MSATNQRDLPAVAVTGASGAGGGEGSRLLAAQGVAQRLLARTPARVPHRDDAVVLECGYDDPRAREALDGVSVLFMVSASEAPDRLAHHRAFVTSAAEAGVGHVVYTSFLGAAPD